MRRRIIHINGTTTTIEGRKTTAELRVLIGARSGLDHVNLRHLGYPLQVMLVDDTAVQDGRPVNPSATKLYWANCKPGATFPIRGVVAIVLDEDFAS